MAQFILLKEEQKRLHFIGSYTTILFPVRAVIDYGEQVFLLSDYTRQVRLVLAKCLLNRGIPPVSAVKVGSLLIKFRATTLRTFFKGGRELVWRESRNALVDLVYAKLGSGSPRRDPIELNDLTSNIISRLPGHVGTETIG